MFAASGIPVHVVDRDECDEFYRANVGSPVLGVCVQFFLSYASREMCAEQFPQQSEDGGFHRPVC